MITALVFAFAMLGAGLATAHNGDIQPISLTTSF